MEFFTYQVGENRWVGTGKDPNPYPSAKQLCSAAKAEYDRELERRKTIIQKVGILLAAAGVLFTTFVYSFIDFRFLPSAWSGESCITLYLAYAVSFLQIAALLDVIVGMAILLAILCRSVYHKVNVSELMEAEFYRLKEAQLQMVLAKLYETYTAENRYINDLLGKKFKWAAWGLFVALVLVAIRGFITVNLIKLEELL